MFQGDVTRKEVASFRICKYRATVKPSPALPKKANQNIDQNNPHLTIEGLVMDTPLIIYYHQAFKITRIL